MHVFAALITISEVAVSDFTSNLPARIIALAGIVSVLTQLVKQFFPKIDGVPAMAVNAALSLCGIFATMDPAQFWTAHTFLLVGGVFSSAAGIHSTARSFRSGAASTAPARAALPMLLVLLGAFTAISGCAAKSARVPAPLPIGAIDQIDATANQTLQAAHAFAQTVSADVSQGAIKLSDGQRLALNRLNLAINAADVAEQVYHSAPASTAQNQKVLEASLTAATSALVQLQSTLAPALVK